MASAFEKKLLRSLKQAVEIHQGKRLPSRETVVTKLPDGTIVRKELSKKEIKERYGKQ